MLDIYSNSMVVVDNRIGSKHLASKLGKLGLEVSLERLEFGDVAFKSKEDKQIGIEIKSIRELFTDHTLNRFTGHQIPGLLDNYDWVYLVVEGLTKRDSDGDICEYRGGYWKKVGYGGKNYTYQTFCKYRNSLFVLAGIETITTASPSDTIEVVGGLYQWWQEGLQRHKSLNCFYSKPPERFEFKTPSLFRRMTKEISGLGWERTKLLEEKYPTMERLLKASEKELAQIPGIGKVLAKEIHRSLRI